MAVTSILLKLENFPFDKKEANEHLIASASSSFHLHSQNKTHKTPQQNTVSRRLGNDSVINTKKGRPLMMKLKYATDVYAPRDGKENKDATTCYDMLIINPVLGISAMNNLLKGN